MMMCGSRPAGCRPGPPLPTAPGSAELIGSAWRLQRYVAGFGIGLFLAGHLLESTVLPLELMFEHRNHLPALGPLLVLCCYLSHPGGRYLSLRQTMLPVLLSSVGYPLLALEELEALTLAHPLRSRTRGVQQYRAGLQDWLQIRQ